jgi:hypothetical protein
MMGKEKCNEQKNSEDDDKEDKWNENEAKKEKKNVMR